jgi:hypothetical protein
MKFIFTAILFSISIWIHAQGNLYPVWDRSYGGNDLEELKSIIYTKDNGFLLSGISYSMISGTKTEDNRDPGHSSADYYIVKLDSNGVMQWDKTYGGNRQDELHVAIQTADSGFMLAGRTFSDSSGDITQPYLTYSFGDFWIVKLDRNGNKQWDRRYGGSDLDNPYSIVQNPDGSYLIGGNSESPAGLDVTEPNRDSTNQTQDYWILKIDAAGNKLWDKRFGGTREDWLVSVIRTQQNQYILTGYSESEIGADKTGYKGGIDYWVIKTDGSGNKIWDRTFGTGDIDGSTMAQTALLNNGDIIVSGRSYSGIDQDKTQNLWGASDFWFLRIDSSGNKIWDKDIGGNGNEELYSVVPTSDHGFLIAGDSYSGISGNKSENNLGFEQSWIIKVDSNFNQRWDKTILTDGHDESGSAVETKDGCYVVANWSYANPGTGYKTAPTNGSLDYWIIKFCPGSINDVQSADNSFSVFPNPFVKNLTVTISNEISTGKMTLLNLEGQVVFENRLDRKTYDLGFLPAGIYILKLETTAGTLYSKIVKSY